MISEDVLHQKLRNNFEHVPTSGQEKLLYAVSRLMVSKMPDCTLIVKGYAGTGKTTSVQSMVRTMKSLKIPVVLLAPTGRAAKVLSKYSGKSAFTIHKMIYRRKMGSDGRSNFVLDVNRQRNALFIVDEASMIGSGGAPSGGLIEARDLLNDLIEYVFAGANCRLILIGDGAQLPPVGSDISPALDLRHLKKRFDLTIAEIQLKEVMRQQLGSGILVNATGVRHQIAKGESVLPRLVIGDFDEVVRVEGTELEDHLEQAFDKYGVENVIVVTRSNKRANLFNQQIRARLLWHEEDLNAGDFLMVVKNNYFWLEGEVTKVANFIANGDAIEILKIVRRESRYDFQFADVEIRLLDYPEIPPFEVKILLDVLTEEGPSLHSDKARALYHYVYADYAHLGTKRKVNQKVMEDPYYNALQVKFAYAVTCHKAQGGQWPAVFVDQGYLNKDMIDVEYLRWMYTAFTRAVNKLYFVNFVNEMFPDEF